MQIKATTRGGKHVLYTPKELIRAAILYAIKMHNSAEKIYWCLEKTIVADDFSSFEVPKTTKKSDPKFHAKASGTVKLGYTDVKTDRFYSPKAYKFEVEYESAKDSLGLPDIKVTKAVLVPVEPNQAKRVSYEALVASQEKLAAHAKEFKAEKQKKTSPKPATTAE